MELTEAMLKYLAEATPGNKAIYQIRGDRIVSLYLSPNLHEIVGMDSEEFERITKNNTADTVLPEDLPSLMEAVRDCIRTKKPLNHYWRVYHPRQGFMWVHGSASCCGELDGFPVMYVAYGTDVNEINLYKGVVDNSRTVALVCDCGTYDVLYANRAAREYCGAGANVLNLKCHACIFGRAEPCEDCFLKTSAKGETVSRYRYNAFRGTWEHLTGKFINWCGHEAFIQYLQDITELKTAEERLANSEKKYSAAVRSAGLYVWEYDIAKRRILEPDDEFTNQDWHKMRLPAVIENVPQFLAGYIEESCRADFTAMYRQLEAGAAGAECEVWFKPLRGAEPCCRRITYTTVFGSDGSPLKAYGIARDVTLQRKSREEYDRLLAQLTGNLTDVVGSFQLNLSRNLYISGYSPYPSVMKALETETADEHIAATAAAITSKELKGDFLRDYSRARLLELFRAGQKELRSDYPVRTSYGGTIWLHTEIRMMQNPTTNDVEAVTYSKDITKQKRSEGVIAQISAGSFDYVGIVDTVDSSYELYKGVWEGKKDLDGVQKISNGAALKLLAANYIEPGERAAFLQATRVEAVAAALEKSAFYTVSYTFSEQARGGQKLRKQLRYSWLNDEKKELLVIQQDVTALYRNQQKELRLVEEAARKTEDILNYIPNGVCVLVMPDEDHLQIEYSNKQMFRLLSQEAEPGQHNKSAAFRSDYCKNVFSGVHPDDLSRVKEAFKKGYRLENFSVPALRLRTNSGTYVWVTIEATLREERPDGRVFYGSYRDVTKEVGLQRELEEQRQKRLERTLLDTIGSLPACSVLYRESGGMLTPARYSDEFCQLKGCTQEEIRSFNSDDGFAPVHPDDRKMLAESLEACRGDNLMHHAVYRISTMNSGYKWVSVNYTRFSVAGQNYLYAVYTDIDDLKKQEQKLEEQYNAAQTFLDSVAGTYLATWRSNLTQNRIEVISGTGSLSAARESSAYDESFAALLQLMPREEDRRECGRHFSREQLLRAYENGARTLTRDFQLRTAEGGVIWLRSVTTLSRRPGSGDVIAFFTARNVSEEKMTDAVMEQIVTKRLDYICCVNANSGRIKLYVSNSQGPAIEEGCPDLDYEQIMAGYNAKHVSYTEYANSVDFMSIANVRRALEHSDSVEASFTVDEGAGLRVKRVEFSWLDREHSLIALVCTDITESQRQQLEQEEKLRTALDAAQQASAAKSDFLSRMSHDMRTPLNGIIGMAYLTGEMELPQKARENLKKIDTSSKFLLSLINDVLDMAKAESGKIELHPEPYDPQDFADYLEAVIRPLCDEKNIKLVIDAQPLRGLRLVIDPLRNNQIFFNLLSNAVKFTPEGGTITYSFREKLTDDGRVALHAEVADTGVGMSEEFQRRLFEPFVQENRNDVSGARGTGLGLSIVKKLIDLMGGTIYAQSKAGEGTTFYMDAVFDYVKDDGPDRAKPLPAADAGMKRLAGRHILLCEDHPLNQEIARSLLVEQKLLVDIAENGQLGVERFKNSITGFYSAILMDVRMPVMDGYEATVAIRALGRPDAGTVPIIAMTADAFAEDVKKCLGAGMNGHVAKPIDPPLLYAALLSFIK